MGYTSAKLHCQLRDGTNDTFEIAISKGHPGNPIHWDDMKIKFKNLVDDEDLLNQITQFGKNQPFTLLRSI
jgi:2-methylcitrate dehydratase PrpD